MNSIVNAIRLVATVAIAMLVASCSTTGTQVPHSAAPAPGNPETAKKEEKPELPPASFRPETLYALLVAELAGQRERYDILLSSYLHQAEKTRDAGIAERATRIAMFLKADSAALSAAKLWDEISEGNTGAKQALGVQLVKAGKHEQALAVFEDILELGEDARFEYLAANTKELSQVQRTVILERFNSLLEQYPDNQKLLFAKAIILQVKGRIPEALAVASTLHELQGSTQSLLMKVRLLHQADETSLAMDALRDALENDTESNQVRLLYAQMLIDTKDLEQAEEQFSILVDRSPEDNQLRLTLALVALENEDHLKAKKHLEQLVKDPKLANDAHYYLGQIAEKQERNDDVIRHYRQVRSGSKLLPAYSRLGQLLIDADKLPEMQETFAAARQTSADDAKSLYLLEADLLSNNDYIVAALALINSALIDYESDINLLYSRAMISEKANDLESMEDDLRTILSVEPDNAMVLNALGYTLADRTDRYHEALELIKRANELKPNDPAITDSLGWAMFRLGNYTEAIRLLEKALAEFPDHEVAAHLGEVLWYTGEYDRAQEVWREALERRPDSKILKRVIERLAPQMQP